MNYDIVQRGKCVKNGLTCDCIFHVEAVGFWNRLKSEGLHWSQSKTGIINNLLRTLLGMRSFPLQTAVQSTVHEYLEGS